MTTTPIAAPASRITLFTTCKPFRGEAARLQRNALRSWSRLHPTPEILVFGDEPGGAEICAEIGARQIREIERTPSGIPTLSCLAEGAEHHATRDFLCLVNADILLTSTLEPAVAACAAHFAEFLFISRRWNLDLAGELDFDTPGWEARLAADAHARGDLESIYGGVDLFLYPRGLWTKGELPPMAMGRGRWDSALLLLARKRGLPLVDATDLALNVHQNHDYSHEAGGVTAVFRGADGVENEALLGGDEFIFSALNATHVLGRDGLEPLRVRNPMLWLRLLATAPALHAWAAPLRPLVHALAPWWRRARAARDARLGRISFASPRTPAP